MKYNVHTHIFNIKCTPENFLFTGFAKKNVTGCTVILVNVLPHERCKINSRNYAELKGR